MNIWIYGFGMVYVLLMLVIYHAYGKKMIQKIQGRDMYLHYHIVDTGGHGDMVFKPGSNMINAHRRVYNRDCVTNGTLFYESGNAEPIRIERDISQYKYYCDTKNFDTVSRNDILQTLMVLRAKDILMFLIVIGIAVTVITCVANVYFIYDTQQQIKDAIIASHIVPALEELP